MNNKTQTSYGPHGNEGERRKEEHRQRGRKKIIKKRRRNYGLSRALHYWSNWVSISMNSIFSTT
jgi:hypothetical protein